MKIELTELELLHVLVMLGDSKIEENKKHAEFIHDLETGIIDKLPRLPETDELQNKLAGLNTMAIFVKFLGIAEELNLVKIE